MYAYLHQRLGPKWAFWLTLVSYIVLACLVIINMSGPAGEFRYGHL